MIYLLRHGETDWNGIKNRFCGRSNVELNEKGLRQSERLGLELKKVVLHEIYHTGLTRSRSTAEYIQFYQEEAGHTSSLVKNVSFQEASFGEWEGKTKGVVMADFKKEFIRWSHFPASTLIPGGESFLALQTRVLAAFFNLAKKHDGQNVAIVGHSTVNRLLLVGLLKAPADSYRRLLQDNCCINIIEMSETGQFSIRGINLGCLL